MTEGIYPFFDLLDVLRTRIQSYLAFGSLLQNHSRAERGKKAPHLSSIMNWMWAYDQLHVAQISSRNSRSQCECSVVLLQEIRRPKGVNDDWEIKGIKL